MAEQSVERQRENFDTPVERRRPGGFDAPVERRRPEADPHRNEGVDLMQRNQGRAGLPLGIFVGLAVVAGIIMIALMVLFGDRAPLGSLPDGATLALTLAMLIG